MSNTAKQSVSHTSLRAYRVEDIPEIARIVCEEIPKMPGYAGLKTSTRRVEFLLNHNLTNALFMCVLVELGSQIVGGVAGQVTMLAFSEEKVAVDLFLFVKPEFRTPFIADRLIKTYTDWAKARGCALITASHSSGWNIIGMERLLHRHGYIVVGQNYHLLNGESK